MKPARTAGLWDAKRQIEIVQQAGLLFLAAGSPIRRFAGGLAATFRSVQPAVSGGIERTAISRSSYLRTPFE